MTGGRERSADADKARLRADVGLAEGHSVTECSVVMDGLVSSAGFRPSPR